MSQSICILGRQPALGLAELESLFGAKVVQPFGTVAAILDCEPQNIQFERLGGTIKLAKLLTYLDTTKWEDIEEHLAVNIPKHLQHVPAGKFKLGISVYGLKISAGKINASGLTLKKIIRSSGRGVRIVPNKQTELNAAQVLRNQLTSPTGWELLIISDGKRTALAQTTSVQDIDAYAARDQARPMRDARIGMLPPKLAQIIVNLSHPGEKATVLDPFCGTGVVLQEAMIMGYGVYGTDLELRMIEFTNNNIEWLQKTFKPLGLSWRLEKADATTADWHHTFDVIASETYLGRPFSAAPTPDVLREVIRDVDYIHRKFLQNTARQTKTGFRMCIAVPAWKTKSGFAHLPTLEKLEELGYNRVSFAHAANEKLIYHRPDQFVARELVVLTRK